MKKIIALQIVWLTLASQHQLSAQINTNVISHYLNGTVQDKLRIATNIPYTSSTQMPTLRIEGYNYGNATTISIHLSWYIFGGEFYNVRASSSGGTAFPITLTNIGGYVNIFLHAQNMYYGRFKVSAYAYGLSEQLSWFQNWAITDEALAGTNQHAVSYYNKFAGTVDVDGIVYATNVYGGNGYFNNMGVGTNTPDAKFQVNLSTNQVFRFVGSSSILADHYTSGSALSFSRPSDGAHHISALFNYQDQYGDARLALATRDDLVFAAGGTNTYYSAPERLRIKGSNGFVGIGTSSPSHMLQVGAGTAQSRVQIASDNLQDHAAVLSLLTSGSREGIMAQSNGSLFIGNTGGLGGSYTDAAIAAAAQLSISQSGEVGLKTYSVQQTVPGTTYGYYQILTGNTSGGGLFGVEGSNTNALLSGTIPYATVISSTSSGTALQFGTAGIVRATFTNTGNLGIGKTNPTEKLEVNGNIKTKKLIVSQAGWPDYVFDKNYRLTSLPVIEVFIAKYGHLPGVPSAAEIALKGLDVGDTQAILLKKIEELTLYLIEQNNLNVKQEKTIAELKQEVKRLKKK